MKKQTLFIDPVCGKRLNKTKAHIVINYNKTDYFLCCPKCQAEFEENTKKYLGQE